MNRFGATVLLLVLLLTSLTTAAAPARATPTAQTAAPDQQIHAQVNVALNTAFGLFRSESYSDALAKLQDVVMLAHSGRDRAGEAQALFGIGLVYASQKDNLQALNYLQQALTIWAEVDNPTVELEALQTIGALYSTPGQYQTAYDFAQQVLTLARSVGEVEIEDAALQSLAYLYLNQSRYPEALQYSLQALDLARRSGKRASEGSALAWVASCYGALGQYPRALTSFQQALVIAKDSNDTVNESLVLGNIGGVYLALSQPDQALTYFQQSLLLARQTGDTLSEGQLILVIGSIALQQGRAAEARRNFDTALNIAQQLGDRLGEQSAITLLGDLELVEQRPAQGIGRYQQALAIAREIGNRAGEGNLLSRVGLAQQLLGNAQTAVETNLQALSILESLRSTARVEDFKTGLGAQFGNIYSRTARLLVRLNRPEEAFDITERARARTFLDQIGNVHLDAGRSTDPSLLQDEQSLRAQISALDQQVRSERTTPAAERNLPLLQMLQSELTTKQSAYSELIARIKLADPETASLIDVNPLRLADVQRLLDPQTTLLSYFVDDDATLTFIVTNNGFHEIDLPVGRAALTKAIADFRSFADLNTATPAADLQQLSDWLVAPISSQIMTPSVALVPNDVLNYLPFAALSDGERRFGEPHTLSYLPSASSLPFIQQKRKARVDTLLPLAAANVEGFPPLRFADTEVQAIAAIYGATPLTGSDATETAFKAMAGRFNLLHLAAHAELNSTNPLFTRILLAPDASNDGSLTVQQVYDLDLQAADLVVLSACQTQLGGQLANQSQGDDFVALNRAFIYAGSPSVIATLWSVNDEATSVLMTSFYQHLHDGLSKAAALQAAQADTRSRFPHPFYWAAFVLNGDPGSTATP